MSNIEYVPLESPNVRWGLLCLCLHGQNEIEGRANSYRAYDSFRKWLPEKYAFVYYTDSKGYPVFQISFFLPMVAYAQDLFLTRWQDACTQFNVVPGTSYEQCLAYHDFILSDQ